MGHQVRTDIEIAASPEKVWAVLADIAGYPEWHPVFRKVSGQLVPGSTLTIVSTIPSTGRTMTVKVKVVVVEPDVELRWVSKLLGYTISERRFLLSPVEGGTWLVQTETYQGLGRTGGRGGRSTFALIDRIRGTFEAINEAIKQQAEARSA